MKEEPELVVQLNGDKHWVLNGELHRENGPAMELASGTQKWYLNGKMHREDGPAAIYSYGSQQWWIHGEPHREDGPAVEYDDGSKEWYIYGEQLTEEEFNSWVLQKRLHANLLDRSTKGRKLRFKWESPIFSLLLLLQGVPSF